ncbi:cytochrome b-c1 complex subunit 10 [Flammula alnicola]|nr:cytochrome b-c1 complex subunit 10 [Flammula alnicola]
MSRLLLHPQSPVGATLNATKRWTLSLGLWGASAGAAALLLLSVTPLVRREVLEKTPVLGLYYQDKTPASDKPF